jgi:cytochrome P450
MLKLVSEAISNDVAGDLPHHDPIYKTPRHVDLASSKPFTKGQPHELFRSLRETSPVAWYPIQDLQGFWAITRYADVKAIELDPETYSSQAGGINMTYGPPSKRHPRLHSAALNTLICLDRPSHIHLRMQHRDFFTPDYVAGLKGRVDVEVDRLLDKMVKDGPVVNMVNYLSNQLPLFTLCEMLGIDKKDRPKIIKWMHYLELAQAMAEDRMAGFINPIFIAKFMYNMRQMFKFGEEILQNRRKNPRKDLLSAIATAEVDGEQLPQEFLDGSWLLILFAGNDTTRNSLSGTMKLLTEFPDQKQKLVDDPSKIANMTSEAIRLVSPVIHMRRTLTKEVELHGQKIAKGEKVLMFYGAANRDPDIFQDPNRFDVDRVNARDHIGFGMGAHVCLGQRIASMQLQSAYTKILERFPNIEWTGEMSISPNNFVHAINRLDVDLGK